MFTIIRLENNFTITPNDLYLVANGDEIMLLLALIQFQGTNSNGKRSCYASISTLSKHMRTTSRNKTVKAIQSLKLKGYIDYIQGDTHGKANEYSVNMDKILYDIRLKLPDKEKIKRAEREYREQELNAMSAKRVGANKKLLVKVASAQNLQVTDKSNGEILN